MLEIFTNLNWAEITGVVVAGVIFFDRLAKITPTQSDDKIVQFAYKAFSILGLKFPDIQTYEKK